MSMCACALAQEDSTRKWREQLIKGNLGHATDAALDLGTLAVPSF